MNKEQLKDSILEILEKDDYSIEEIEQSIQIHKTWIVKNQFDLVCKLSAESVGTIMSFVNDKTRKFEFVMARRFVFMYYVKMGCSLTEIGDMFNQHHATILHGLRVIKNDIEFDKRTRAAFYKFQNLIKYHLNIEL